MHMYKHMDTRSISWFFVQNSTLNCFRTNSFFTSLNSCPRNSLESSRGNLIALPKVFHLEIATELNSYVIPLIEAYALRKFI